MCDSSACWTYTSMNIRRCKSGQLPISQVTVGNHGAGELHGRKQSRKAKGARVGPLGCGAWNQQHPGHRSGGCEKPSLPWLGHRLADFQSIVARLCWAEEFRLRWPSGDRMCFLLRALQRCTLWLWEQTKKAKASWLDPRTSLTDDFSSLQCVCMCVCVHEYMCMCACVYVHVC